MDTDERALDEAAALSARASEIEPSLDTRASVSRWPANAFGRRYSEPLEDEEIFRSLWKGSVKGGVEGAIPRETWIS